MSSDADPMLYEHDREVQRQFKRGVSLFVAATLLFALGSSQVAYILDLVGVTGVKPVSEESLKTRREEVRKAAAAAAVPTRWTLDGDIIYLQKAGTPPKIDGDVGDWNLNRGVFVVDNYREHAGTMSMWCHLAYDERMVYALYRLRDATPSTNSDDVKSSPAGGDYAQLSFLTDVSALVNFWQADAGWRLQVCTLTGKEDIQRIDAVGAGGMIAAKPHDDEQGFDIELAIPWKLLARQGFNGNPLPQDGQRVQVAFGACLSKEIAIGKLTVDAPIAAGAVQHGLLWPGTFAESQPLAVVGEDFLYPTYAQDEQMKVAWDNPIRSFRSVNREWLITRANEIVVDGKTGDWPLAAGMVCTENAGEPSAGNFWLHGAIDDQRLYVMVMVQDPTPAQIGDAVTISLKNEKIHQLLLAPNAVRVDGQDLLAAGGLAATELWSNGAGYTIEAAIPLARLGGPLPDSLPATCTAAFSNSWTFYDLSNGIPMRYQADAPDTWGQVRFGEVPDEPFNLPMPDGNVLPYRIADGRPLLPGRGWTVCPYSTGHRYLDILPGTAVLDGEFKDWDLSGGVFICKDVRVLRGCSAAWVHAMYDDRNVYFLLRYVDPTPLSHRPVTSHRDDCCQIRFVTEHVLHDTLWMDEKGSTNYLIEIGDFGGNPKPTPVEDHGVKMVFKKDLDQMGYVQEIAFPWRLLRPSGAPYKAGETCRVTFEIRTDLDFVVRDCLRQGSNYAMAWNRIQDWGEARFRESGNIQPQPCRLWNGQRLPVTMSGGQPAVDWSALR